MPFFANGYHERVKEVISLGVENGEIPNTVDPQAASILFMGFLQHLITRFRLTGYEKEIDLVSGVVFDYFRKFLSGGNG